MRSLSFALQRVRLGACRCDSGLGWTTTGKGFPARGKSLARQRDNTRVHDPKITGTSFHYSLKALVFRQEHKSSPPGTAVGRLGLGTGLLVLEPYACLGWISCAWCLWGFVCGSSGRAKWQTGKCLCVQLSQDEMKMNWKKELSELRVSRIL